MSCLQKLDRKCAILSNQCLMDFLVLAEDDDFEELLIEDIRCDILDNRWETLSFREHFEVNGVVRREIFMFRFYA